MQLDKRLRDEGTCLTCALCILAHLVILELVTELDWQVELELAF